MTTLQEAAQRALHDAATSLETIGRLAGKTHYVGDDGEKIETYMGHHDQVRGYAQSRAAAAREALAALASEPQAEPHIPTPDDIDAQDWAGMDGAIAFHLIDRHAENWSHAARLMHAWRDANPPAVEQPGAVGLSDEVVTWQQAVDAIDDMDDYARMMVGVDPSGPRECLYRFVEQARAALATQPAAPGWLPIETAPTDGTIVLTFRLLNDEPQIADARFSALSGCWGRRSWSYPASDGPTHWQPLPPPPVATQGAKT